MEHNQHLLVHVAQCFVYPAARGRVATETLQYTVFTGCPSQKRGADLWIRGLGNLQNTYVRYWYSLEEEKEEVKVTRLFPLNMLMMLNIY